MATILDAVRREVLIPYEVPDWYDGVPVRPLYVAPQLWDWIDNEARAHKIESSLGRRSRYEQMEIMFAEFRCGPRALGHAELKRMTPTANGVWKMHPPGLRVYGWCPSPHAFVAVKAAILEDVKADKKLSDSHRDDVLDFIQHAGLSSSIALGDYIALFPPTK